MGLPEIIIEFKSKAVSAIQRSEKGIVALIIRDTNNVDVEEYRALDEVVDGTFLDENRDYIAQAFMGTPTKVIVCNIGDEGAVSEGLQKLKTKKWNYLAVPFAETETTDIASFIKSQRLNEKKTYKAVLANEQADSEGVINFTTDEIKIGETVYSAAQYTPRIAGILAGLPFTRSATYFVLNEVESVKEHDDPDTAINNGELILINDGEKIKIGRGVNSLTEFTPEKSKSFSKITLVDKMDLVLDDIRSTFNDNWVGKVNNGYDEKLMFLSAVNAYFQGIANDGILDSNFDNRAEINFEAQRLYLQSIGVNVDDMTVQEILEYPTDSIVFASANVRFQDSMEDLFFDISV